MIPLIKAVVETLISTVKEGSYPLIFILMTLESALIPIPSEVVMPFAGFLVHLGEMDYWLAVVSGILGNLVGSLIAYWAGLKVGWEPFKRIPLVKAKIEHAERFMNRYGEWAVLLGRVTPAIRTVISLPAGMSGMGLAEFVILTVLGSIPWNAVLVYSGMVLGEQWEIISEYLDVIALLIVIIVLAYLLIASLRRGRSS